MLRTIGLTLFLLLIGVTGYASATPVPSSVPEIDPSSSVAALALLSGGFMVLRARRKVR